MPVKVTEIVGLVQEINAYLPILLHKSSHFFDDQDLSSSLEEKTRQSLIRAAEKLVIASRRPDENLYATATNTAQNAAIRTAISFGAFDSVPSDGSSISAQEIAAKSNADKQLVVRIMRACTACHLFDETATELYAHNTYSRCFVPEANRDMFRQMYDFGGKATYALPEFLEKTRWQNPQDYANSAWQVGHNTEQGIWEFLDANPQRMNIFNSGMRSLATVANSDVGPYPFVQELNAEPLADDEVVLVDVGGGHGQALERIKNDFPTLKGRICLQDQPHVIQDAEAKGLPADVETQGMSFFQPNPIKGARAYHFRRIFHDWSDQASIEILRNTAQAMNSNSRILISDTTVPSRGAPRATALQDLNMMAFAGMERTEEAWQDLIQKAGLKFVRFWRKEGSMHVIVESRLNEDGEAKLDN